MARTNIIETSETARLLGRSASWVRQQADAGKLPVAVRTASGQRLFDRTVVEKFRLQREGK